MKKVLVWCLVSSILIVLFISLLFVRRHLEAQYPSGCKGELSEVGSQDEFQQIVQQILSDFSADNQDIALQATILKPAEGMWSAAAGVANRSRGCLADSGNYFYIGSVSKTYTAALVLKLSDEGLLELDDAVSDWLPMPDHTQGITVRQLLQQTSGLPSYTDRPLFLVQWLFRPEKHW